MTVMNATTFPTGFLGWSLIDVGDIVASIAIAISLTLFFIGYNRQRNSDERKIKSDQLRISLELMDRVLAKRDRVDSYLDRVKTDETLGYSNSKHLALINDVLDACDYFGYVIEEKEIDREKIKRRYGKRIFEHWRDMNIDGFYVIERLDKSYPNKQYPLFVRRLIKNHNDLKASVLERWQKAY